MEIIYIYALRDPITFEFRYIGQTNDLVRRYNRHLSPSQLLKEAKYYKTRWLLQLKELGLKPIMQVLAECPQDEVNDAEIMYIRWFKKSGHRLTNMTEGGEGTRGRSPIMTPEIIEKISSAQRGRLWAIDDPRREAIRTKQKGIPPMHATNKATIANSKDWVLTDPEGRNHNVTNLSAFCKPLRLISSKLAAVADGKENRTHHKGWKCRRAS